MGEQPRFVLFCLAMNCMIYMLTDILKISCLISYKHTISIFFGISIQYVYIYTHDYDYLSSYMHISMCMYMYEIHTMHCVARSCKKKIGDLFEVYPLALSGPR